MSDRRYTAIFGAALLVAGAATAAVYRLVGAAAEPRREPTQFVVVVGRDVPAGMPVPREALTLVAWPSRVAPPEGFASPDSVAGRVARVAMARGEPVRASALAPRGATPGLESTIDPAHRAIAVRVSEAAGVSGLVQPNSRVDVLLTGRDDSAGGAVTTRVVMTDVRVLGVGSARPADPEPDAEKKANGDPPPASIASIVTLEVTPVQAAAVAAAEGQGTLQVVLRGFGSVGDAAAAVAAAAPAAPAAAAAPVRAPRPAAPRAVAAASPAPAPPAAVAPAPRPAAPPADDSTTVRVYRGGQLSVLRFESARPAAPRPPARALPQMSLGSDDAP